MLDLVRVTVDNDHVVEADAESVGRHLGEGRLLTLTVGRNARVDGDVSARLDAYGGAFPGAHALLRRGAGRGPDAAHLGERGETDSDQAAVRPRATLRCARFVVASQFDHPIERLVVVAGVVHGARGGGVGEGALVDEVPAPHGGRIQTGGRRHFVHHPFDDVGGLRASGAAVGLGRHGVRVDRSRVPGDRLDVVTTAGHGVGRESDEWAVKGTEGADVGDRLALERQHPAVVLEGDLDLLDVAPAVGHAEEILGSGLGPLDRPAQGAGNPAQERVLRVGRYLRSEAAADFGCDGADADLGDAEAHRDLLLDEVRRLVGGPDGQLAGTFLPVRADGPAFDREGRHALVEQAHRERLVGLLEELVGLRVRSRDLEADVAVELLVHPGRARRHRRLDIDDRFARFDVYIDLQGSVAGGVGSLSHDNRHRLADVEHPATRQQRMVGPAHSGQLDADRAGSDLPVHVGVGVNADDARMSGRSGGVDGTDGAGREVAAHEGGIGHPRQLHVVRVGGETPDQAGIFAALDRLAD